jgi:hypothetical protein
MFQIATILGWNMIRLVRLARSKLSATMILQSCTVFDVYNMTSLTLAGLLFYLQTGFARTFTPSILIVYLLQVAKKDYRFLATLLALNVAFFYLGIVHSGASKIINADFTTEFPQGDQLQL